MRRTAHGSRPTRVAEETFLASKLDWDDREADEHADWLSLYRTLLRIRRDEIVPRLDGIEGYAGHYEIIADRALKVWWTLSDGSVLTMLANLTPEPLDGVNAWDQRPSSLAGGDRHRLGPRALECRGQHRGCQGPGFMSDGPRPVPRATYRLQLSKDFTFRDVEAIAGYLGELGVSHAYLSPILEARPGSTHGYDTVDHTRINPELGTLDDFRRMAGTLRAAGALDHPRHRPQPHGRRRRPQCALARCPRVGTRKPLCRVVRHQLGALRADAQRQGAGSFPRQRLRGSVARRQAGAALRRSRGRLRRLGGGRPQAPGLSLRLRSNSRGRRRGARSSRRAVLPG